MTQKTYPCIECGEPLTLQSATTEGTLLALSHVRLVCQREEWKCSNGHVEIGYREVGVDWPKQREFVPGPWMEN